MKKYYKDEFDYIPSQYFIRDSAHRARCNNNGKAFRFKKIRFFIKIIIIFIVIFFLLIYGLSFFSNKKINNFLYDTFNINIKNNKILGYKNNNPEKNSQINVHQVDLKEKILINIYNSTNINGLGKLMGKKVVSDGWKLNSVANSLNKEQVSKSKIFYHEPSCFTYAQDLGLLLSIESLEYAKHNNENKKNIYDLDVILGYDTS